MGQLMKSACDAAQDLPEQKREQAVARFYRALERAALDVSSGAVVPVGPAYRIGRDIAREDPR